MWEYFGGRSSWSFMNAVGCQVYIVVEKCKSFCNCFELTRARDDLHFLALKYSERHCACSDALYREIRRCWAGAGKEQEKMICGTAM